MNAIAALFRVPASVRVPLSLEQRVAQLERDVRFYQELSDEQHYRLVDLEIALERRAVPVASVAA